MNYFAAKLRGIRDISLSNFTKSTYFDSSKFVHSWQKTELSSGEFTRRDLILKLPFSVNFPATNEVLYQLGGGVEYTNKNVDQKRLYTGLGKELVKILNANWARPGFFSKVLMVLKLTLKIPAG